MENENGVENQNNDQGNNFDVSSFVKDNDVVVSDNNNNQNNNNSNEFTWDMDFADNNDGNQIQNNNEGKVETQVQNQNGTDNAGQLQNNDQSKNNDGTVVDNNKNVNFDFKSIAKELGLGEDVADAETFKTKVKEIVKVNEQARSLTISNEVQSVINNLETFKALTDEELVTKDLILQKFTPEEAKDVVDTYKENNTLKIEAVKIRKFIDSEIGKQKQIAAEKVKSKETKQEIDIDNERKEFKSLLDKTETMFGFKIADTPEKMQEIRNKHYEYVTNRKFLEEVFESQQSLLEASWLWRNRKIILNAVQNKGHQLGKKEILDRIQNPEVKIPMRNIDPSGKTNEFDKDAFLRD
jgi:hypothetical protein